MLELADIFRRHGSHYRASFADRLLPSHRRAMRDIEDCRTEALGGHLYRCQDCAQDRYSYHSCKNRHCPKCQNQQASGWLDKQSTLLLPVPYFLLTFTLPQELRPLARSHQKSVYNLLFRCSAAALQKLARDPKYLGGEIGMVGVLQTWTRDLHFHPHVHYLVPGGGPSRDGQSWMATQSEDFLVPVRALSVIFRAKLRDAFHKARLSENLPRQVWRKKWVVDCQPVGSGQSVLRYLAPYIYRIALSNSRLEKLQQGRVTFRYRQSGSREWKRTTLEVHEFLRRFLQHVLPKGFQKIRYYGFLSAKNRKRLDRIKSLVGQAAGSPPDPPKQPLAPSAELPCPLCGGPLILVGKLSRRQRGPP